VYAVTPALTNPTIIAVVVTFNRRALLERLLDVLGATPDLAEIVVVDNASTDGTTEWLADGFAGEGVPVHAVTLAENLGGAGGFHEGLRLALERGADLAWLMDDDGVPVEGCLATLLEHDYDFWGPAVLAEQDPSRLCFPIRLPGRSQVVHAMADVETAAVANHGVLDDIVIPFNGVLVTRQLAEEIGLPREEFFIWGDDHEYRLRAEKAGARIATVVDAHFLHPATDDLGTPMAFGRTTYNHTPSDLKHYCMARNNVVNLRDYRGWLFVLAFVLKTLWFYAFTRPSAHRLRLSAEGIRAGLRNDFSGHRRFLQ
jgi:rhamnopyranosyl-N-acetylglucosaminyl-diphospho-decaprenol beta-1,3/1,4-galactofuranosyltransferase